VKRERERARGKERGTNNKFLVWLICYLHDSQGYFIVVVVPIALIFYFYFFPSSPSSPFFVLVHTVSIYLTNLRAKVL